MNFNLYISSYDSNLYLFNIENREINLIHPYMYYLLVGDNKKNRLSIFDIDYYKSKIAYYEKYGIISKKNIAPKEKFVLSQDTVKDNVINLKQIVLETTEKCNLKCKYCYYGEFYDNSLHKEKKTDMPIEYADRILNYLSEMKSSTGTNSYNEPFLISFYGGEPLLNHRLIAHIIKSTKEASVRYSMTTNGTLIDKNLSLLTDNEISLSISMDGDEYNNGYRIHSNGINSYYKIVSNISLLREKYSAYFEQKVEFNAVLHNRNSVESIYNFFKKEYNKLPNILELNASGIQKEKEREFYDTYTDETESLFMSKNYEAIEEDLFISASTYKIATMFLFQNLQFVYETYEDLLNKQRERKTIFTGTCTPFSRKMFISAKGNILPCEKISSKYKLGWINEEDIILDISSIVYMYNKYFTNLYKMCKHCYRQNNCSQCIFFIDDIENNPKCHSFINKDGMKEYLKNCITFFEKHPEAYIRIMNEVTIS